MFTLDAELRSERCTFSDQKNKIRSQERVKDFTANGKKNEKTDIEEMTKNCTEGKKMQPKLFTSLKKLLRTKKVT